MRLNAKVDLQSLQPYQGPLDKDTKTEAEKQEEKL
jgi:hypothetical protein